MPLIIGYLPFGLVLGATVAASTVPTWLGVASSPLVFAGSAQLALLEVLGSGGGIPAAVLKALAINLRHVLYSADMSPWSASGPAAWAGRHLPC